MKKVFLVSLALAALLYAFFFSFRPNDGVSAAFDPRNNATVYTVAGSGIKWIVYRSELNSGIIKHTSESAQPIKEQIGVLDKIVTKVLQSEKLPLKKLFFGRLDNSFGKCSAELSARLATAAQSAHLAEYSNVAVKKLLNDANVFGELGALFQRHGLLLAVSSVEKVRVSEQSGLPFDCVVWFSLGK